MSVQSDIDRILDVFGGVDGGIEFVILKYRLEDFEKKAFGPDADENALGLIEILHKFRRLIDAITQG